MDSGKTILNFMNKSELFPCYLNIPYSGAFSTIPGVIIPLYYIYLTEPSRCLIGIGAEVSASASVMDFLTERSKLSSKLKYLCYLILILATTSPTVHPII
jgi:hypothetical protein